MNWWLHNSLLQAGLKAFAVSVILTPILRDIFRSYNVVDVPGQRRVHKYPIPRIGGIPIALAYAFALYSVLVGTDPGIGAVILKLLPGAGVVFLIGLVDDFFSLSPWIKLGGQIAAALLVYWNGLSITTLGSTAALPVWLNLPLTVFWLLLTTNALNLIDGLDGLCAGIGLLATLTMFGAAMLYGNKALAFATLPLVFALVGFLIYNISPATVFLGDSGALLIGFLLGCYGMIWSQKTSTILSFLVPIMAISVPLLDVVMAILRRALRKRPIFGADRAHIHHRLLDRGLTAKRAVLVLYLFAGVVAGLALLLISPQAARFRNVVLLLLVAAVFLGLRELRYEEFRVFGERLWGGKGQPGMEEHVEEQGEKQREEHMEERPEERRGAGGLTAALRDAHAPEDCWAALLQVATDSGWSRLSWVGPQGRKDAVISSAEVEWKLTIQLGPWGTLEIGGPAHSAIPLTDFADAIRATVGGFPLQTSEVR